MTMKKTVRIVLAVVAVLVLGAVAVGILNALVADGKWTFGWDDYRYDDSGYQIGQGTVSVTTLREIEIDWLDGEVRVEACDDSYPSVTELYEGDIPESYRLRWQVSEDGSRLSVKYRKSAWFFSPGASGRNKTLILRIPKAMMANLRLLDVESDSAKITVAGITAEVCELESGSGSCFAVDSHFQRFSAETETGHVVMDGTVREFVEFESGKGSFELASAVCPRQMEIETARGNVVLHLPADSDFKMICQRIGGTVTSDFVLMQTDNVYVCKNGTCVFSMEEIGGNLSVTIAKN